MRSLLWGTLPLQAWAAWCGMVVEPDTLDFGTLALGQEYRRQVWVANTGAGELLVQGVQLQQWAWGGFSVRADTARYLAPGERIALEVVANFRHNVTTEALLLLRLQCAEAEWSYPCLLRVRVQDPDTLYRGTDDLWGEVLRAFLQQVVRMQHAFPYDSARRLLFLSVDNRDGYVECVYTGSRVRVPPVPPASLMNIEHSWPRSRGADTLPPLSDMHHLFPSLAEANAQRRDLPFGVVRRIWWEAGGSRHGLDSSGAEVFEPRDRHKGNVARALFYVALRYGNMAGFLTAAHEALLRRWHWQDTVDEWERKRNLNIAQLQGRGNPFIDRPQLVERLYRIGGPADAPSVPVVLLSDSLLEYRGYERRWRLRLAYLNSGWVPVELRGIEPLLLPEGITLLELSTDSLVLPGRVGWATLELQAQGEIQGRARFRFRFAAGVRPLEVEFRLSSPSGVFDGVPTLSSGELLCVRWPQVPEGAGDVQLHVFSLLGLEQELRPYLRWTPTGIEAPLPRQQLPRGWLLFRLRVGQQVMWQWGLNP